MTRGKAKAQANAAPEEKTSIYQALPEEFLECLMSRRHAFPPLRNQRRQHVVIRWGKRPDEAIDTTEFIGTCALCGTERTLVRDRYTHTFLRATYDYPEGYKPPPGVRWDRGAVFGEYDRRFPVTGAPVVRDVTPSR